MAFADTATIEVRAGKGGDGRMGFRHEKYRARGGPDGGDGGRGGDIVFQVDHNSSTLSSYRTARTIRAEDGQPGGDNRKHGKSGGPTLIKMPPGTQVWEGEQLVADLTEANPEAVIARGGRGGFGNAHFISSTRQAPRTAELGEPGETRKLRLELKLVADVGLVGLPNAGKSTLLSVISNARPEIGDYAFTTLTPNLGLVEHYDTSFLVADIPGLIEGASAGKGLGDEFLRHIERTAVILHLIDAATPDLVSAYATIQTELAQYGTDLTAKPQLLVLTKSDTVLPEELTAAEAALRAAAPKTPLFAISAQTHSGLDPLLGAAAKLVVAARADRDRVAAELPVIDATSLPDFWRVEPDGDNTWRITGERLEGFARRTNFDSPETVARLRDILRKTGVTRELRRQGAQPGDTLHLGAAELIWND
jgi:GTPase